MVVRAAWWNGGVGGLPVGLAYRSRQWIVHGHALNNNDLALAMARQLIPSYEVGFELAGNGAPALLATIHHQGVVSLLSSRAKCERCYYATPFPCQSPPASMLPAFIT